MYKVTWMESGKMQVQECSGFGEGLIFARDIQQHSGQSVEIWERKVVV